MTYLKIIRTYLVNKFKLPLKGFLLAGSFYTIEEYFNWISVSNLGNFFIYIKSSLIVNTFYRFNCGMVMVLQLSNSLSAVPGINVCLASVFWFHLL